MYLYRSYIKILQETASIKKAAEEVPTSQPCVIVTVREQDVKDAFLVIEKNVICRIPYTDLPLALLAAFYTFNMHYPEGCNNIYSFFEAALLGKKHSPCSRFSHPFKLGISVCMLYLEPHIFASEYISVYIYLYVPV